MRMYKFSLVDIATIGTLQFFFWLLHLGCAFIIQKKKEKKKLEWQHHKCHGK